MQVTIRIKLLECILDISPIKIQNLYKEMALALMKDMLRFKRSNPRIDLETDLDHLSMDSNSSSMLHDNLPLDIILIDADSKDPSSSISAPPPEFVTEETLECMYELMSENYGGH